MDTYEQTKADRWIDEQMELAAEVHQDRWVMDQQDWSWLEGLDETFDFEVSDNPELAPDPYDREEQLVQVLKFRYPEDAESGLIDYWRETESFHEEVEWLMNANRVESAEGHFETVWDRAAYAYAQYAG